MSSKDSQAQALSSFCQNSSSLKTKLALSTFYRIQNSALVEKFTLIIEYLQLISQAIFSSSFAYSIDSKNERYIFSIIIYALKLIIPSYLLNFQDSMTSTVYIILLIGSLLKLVFSGAVLYSSIKEIQMNSSLFWPWRWIYRLQTRVLYFLFTSFWVRLMIEAKERDFRMLGMNKSSILSIGSIMIAIEFLFSLMLEIQLCYFLPTKNFLSSKNNKLPVLTFLHKVVIQVLMLCFESNSQALAWLVALFGMIIGAFKLYELFLKLPLYHTKALLLQASLLSIVISANFAQFINLLLKTTNSKVAVANINFVLTTWILVALLLNKVLLEALKAIIFSLLVGTPESRQTPEMLLHKVIFAKELEKNERIPTLDSLTIKFDYLALIQHNVNMKQTFMKESQNEFSEETKNKIYLEYYQQLLKKYPNNFLLKLHLVFRSLKESNKSYAKIIKMINEIQGNIWSRNYLSSSLLLYEIEQSILTTHEDGQTIDVYTYVKSKLAVENLQKKMLEQTDLHVNVCKNMLNDYYDIGEIHSSAQKMSSLKTMIVKEIEKLTKTLPESYISPLLCYAEYFLVTSYSVTAFKKYYDIYTQRHSRVQKFFKEIDLMEENLYQSSNAFLLISGQKVDFGKILFCNTSFVNLCGGCSIKYYKNLSIFSLFPVSIKSHYGSLLKETENTIIHRVYLQNKENHLIEVDLCINYHPYLTQGLCFNLIIRPVPVSEDAEFLLLKDDGEIEGASAKFSRLLGLNKIQGNFRLSIKNFSDQLYQAVIALKRIQHNNDGDDEKALEMSSAYTSKCQEIQLQFKNNGYVHKYYSQIQVLDYEGCNPMKLVRLKAATGGGIQPEVLETKDSNASENLDCKELEDYLSPILTDQAQNLPSNCQLTVETQNGEAPLLLSSDRKNLLLGSFQGQSPQLGLPALISEIPDESKMDQLDSKLYQKKRTAKYLSSQESPGKSDEDERLENRAYKAAILSKSYPKSFTLLCIVFYLVILMTFVSQLLMKTVSDSTMKDLQIRTNLLKHSEEKFYKGAMIQVNTRGVTLVLEQYLQQGGNFVSIATNIASLQLRYADMKEANDRMMDNVYHLDQETQEKLFTPDILMKGTYLDYLDPTQKYVDIFQITGEVGNAVKTLRGLNSPDNYAEYHYNVLKYLIQNLINDFLYKSAQVTNILIEVVQKQRRSFQDTTNVFLVLNPFLLTGIGALLIFIILNQYRIEKEQMEAFIKIPSRGVQIIAEQLAQFKKDLAKEETFEDKWASNMSQELKSLDKIDRASSYSKSAENHQIRYASFRTRYQKYILRVILCMSILVTITLVDLITTHHSIKVIYNLQNQMQFANYISNRVLVTHQTFIQLFYTNNTMKVEHMEPLEGLKVRAELLKQILSEIPDRFLQVDGSYNPEIQKILFVNNPTCKGFVPSFIHYCTVLIGQGKQVNLMAALNYFQRRIATKLLDYYTVKDKSLAAIAAAANWGEFPLQSALVLTETAHRMAGILDKSMNEKILEMEDTKLLIIVIFSVGLVIVSVVIWFYILKAIREVNNDFKKVLQIFPSTMILSSFLLKRFLQQTTSNGSLLK